MKNWKIFLLMALTVFLLPGIAMPNNTGADNLKSVLATSEWALNGTVDLGGTFPVTADMVLETNGSSFIATVTTKTIGGAVEVYTMPIPGTIIDGVYTVTNCSVQAEGEQVTINTLTFTINGNT